METARNIVRRSKVRAPEEVCGYENTEPIFHRMAEADARQRNELRTRIIELCLPLAEHIARRFSGRNENFEDLEQAARLGLVLAVDRFDVSRGTPFLSFAVPTIMGEVRRHFRDHTWAMHVPRPVKDLNSRTAPATEALINRLQRTPTHAEIAAELGVDNRELTLARLASHCYRPDSIDTPSTDDDDAVSVPAKAVAVEEHCYSLVDEAVTVRPLLALLPEDERELLVMRYYKSMSQSQIAQQIGTSQMQVSRLLLRTLSRLRCQALPDDN